MPPQRVPRLRFLDDRKPTWRRPEDDVVAEVIIPTLQAADRFDCMVGYFGGAALRELSHGLAAYILRGDQPIRLLVSPVLSEVDQDAIRRGTGDTVEILTGALDAAFVDETALASALAQHTRRCFAYLLAKRRMVMKAVFVQEARFHLKEWIFRADRDVAVLSGSANFTGQALLGNVERLNLHRSWRGADGETACREVVDEFDSYWSNTKPHAIAVDLPTAVREGLIESYDTGQAPTEADYRKALHLENMAHQSGAKGFAFTGTRESRFGPPAGLVWETGTFEHQGTAVLRWEGAARRGILSMATGAGKTVSGLLCAWRLWREMRRLAIVIIAPTRPLLNQWADECYSFNLSPYVARGSTNKTQKLREIDSRLQAVELGSTDIEAIIATHDFLGDSEFRAIIEAYDGPLLLIADEVHNLGVPAFLDSSPIKAQYRLGLSATPERQYDIEGTAGLKAYFGETVFEFGLEDAIGVCLVPYDYCLHEVELSQQEVERYRELSSKIQQLHFITESNPNPENERRLQQLRNRRRLILEGAEAKLELLDALLSREAVQEIRHTLVYATDKDPDQLDAVNEILRAKGLRFHQITASEAGKLDLVDAVLNAFRKGSLQVLTAKRVLDEGINVPEISTAIILASTTVKRQWVQRRGRVLRMCPAIGKEFAVIHDFIVLPPATEERDDDVRSIIEGEVARCDEFTRLARNRASPRGPRDVLQDVRLKYIV